MKEEIRRKIEEIMDGMRCSKAFRCAESGFETLCQAGDFAGKQYLTCLEADPARCSFAFSFGKGWLCECPLRVFIAKKLKR